MLLVLCFPSLSLATGPTEQYRGLPLPFLLLFCLWVGFSPCWALAHLNLIRALTHMDSDFLRGLLPKKGLSPTSCSKTNQKKLEKWRHKNHGRGKKNHRVLCSVVSVPLPSHPHKSTNKTSGEKQRKRTKSRSIWGS